MEKRKILYIGTPIFNYHKKIISEFELMGYSVDFYNDRPSESSVVKGLLKIKKNLMNSFIEKYFNKILTETKDKNYELVFIVNCKVFTARMILQLREIHKFSRFVLYMWDSLSLYPNSKNLIPIFDTAYSFDLDDSENIENLKFLPLFFSKEYENIGKISQKGKKYHIASVCTAHTNRIILMNKIFPFLEAKGINIFSYMYLNKLQYLYNMLFVKEFKGTKIKDFKFIPLSEKENLEVITNSIAIFDVQHNMQSGLTMRTIETLGAKRKLITSNKNIVYYDFYNENNIFVLDDNNYNDIEKFLEQDYKHISCDIYNKYSLHSWVESIINEIDNKYLK